MAMSSDLLKCSNCNIVINEVLAFVNNKLDVMDEESLSRICISAFSAKDIVDAKKLLFDSVPSAKRKITRKRDGKTLRDIDDIICLLKSSRPEEIPTFVALQLQKLPPISFDHVDVTKILKDLVMLQRDICNIKEQYATTEQVDMLKSDIESLKRSSTVNNYSYSNVNTRRGAYFMNSMEASGPIGLSPVVDESQTKNSPISSPENLPFCLGVEEGRLESPPARSDETVTAVRPCESSHRARAQIRPAAAAAVEATNTTDQLITTTNAPPVSMPTTTTTLVPPLTATNPNSTLAINSNKTLADIVRGGNWKSEQPSEDWILVQKKKLKNRFAGNRGTAISDASSKFKAAEVKCPLYIYNVAKGVSEADICSYIQNKTHLDVTVKRMDMKLMKDYESYKVFVPETKIDIFMQDDFWPEGIAFRRFIKFSHRKQNAVGTINLNDNGQR